MKNAEKFPKGCRKVRPPALHPLCITAPVAIYIHCDEYIFTMVSIYVHHVGHTSPANKQLFSQNLNQNYHYENNIIFIDKTIYIQQYLQEL